MLINQYSYYRAIQYWW